MVADYTQHRTDMRSVTGKGKKRRVRLFMLILLCFLVWAGFRIYDQYTLAQAKAEQLAETEQKLMKIRQLNEEYKLEIQRLQDPEYIEQKIYKDLQMKLDGDTLYQLHP